MWAKGVTSCLSLLRTEAQPHGTFFHEDPRHFFYFNSNTSGVKKFLEHISKTDTFKSFIKKLE